MNVGIIGIGNMGSAMAARLLELGWSVAVRDLDAQRELAAQALGATVWPTPAALAAHSNGVIVCVVDAQQTEDVLFGAQGAAPALAPGAAVMLCPTIAPADTERCAARLAAYGIDVIDAPMSGGPQRARLGQMSLLVACADAVFERHRVLLQALASRLFRIGTRPGDGARLKLVNNLLAAINLAGAAEALALAERVGLDMARTLEVIEHSSGQSWIATDRMRRAIAGDLVPRAHTTLLNKDTQLGLSMAAQAGFNAALGAQAAAAFAQACAAGWGDRDDACLLELMRNKPRRQ
jgi:3-hydroxyisobutyrate dehydrogenase